MKLKTSCFNKTIFAKNATLFWPIWSVYLLFLLALMPINLLIRFQRQIGRQSIGYTLEQRNLSELNEVLGQMNVPIVAAFAMSGILAIALFSYLFNSRSTNMIHALPVTRGELFGTNVISGLTFLVIPEMLAFVLSVFVCLTYGVTCVQHLAAWVVAMIGISFLSFGMAVFCAMLTGQMFAAVAYYVIANFLYVGIRSILGLVISTLTFGVNYYDVINAIHLESLSPLYYVYRLVSFSSQTKWQDDDTSIVTGINFDGAEIVARYVAFAIILYVLAYVLYRKRKLEKAGDLLTVSAVKPIFRWGAGFTGSLILAYLVSEIIKDMCWGSLMSSLIVGILVFGMMFFFMAEMLIQKSFKVFCRKKWLEWSVFSLALLASFGGMCGISAYLENRVPDANKVAAAFVEMEYPVEYDGDEVQKVIELQNEILEQKDTIKERVYYGCEYQNATIRYVFDNGEILSRDYAIPQDDEALEIKSKITAAETEYNHFMRQTFCYNFEDAIIAGGNLELYDSAVTYKGTIQMDVETAEAIYKAIQKDVEEGNIQKYTLSGYEEDYKESPVNFTSDLYLRIRYPEGAIYQDTYSRYMSWPNVMTTANTINEPEDLVNMAPGGKSDIPYKFSRDGEVSVNIPFGRDCVNTIQALLDCGVIKSEDELQEYNQSVYGAKG